MDYVFVALLVVAYFIGNISPGRLLVKFRTGGDVRKQGSGGTGATNAARALGKRWFYVVLALDMAKAIFAVLLPSIFGVAGDALLFNAVACGTAVIAGHIFPVAMGFRGGKGVGPFLGVWIGLGFVALPAFWFLPFTLLTPIAGGLFFLPLKKGAFMSALCALWTQPIIVWFLTDNDAAALLSLVITVLILVAHRSNFKKAFGTKPALT